MKKISIDIVHLFSFFRKNATSSPNSNDTDMEFLEHIGFRFVMLFFLLVFFDTLIDLLLTTINYVFEIIHLFIEIIETLLEDLLEHLLQTDHFQSEAIIVNSCLILAIYACYKFIRSLPELWNKCIAYCSSVILNYKQQTSADWHALTLQRKFLLITAYFISSLCLFFFLPI